MINRFNKFTVLIAKINRIIHKIKDSEMKKLGLKALMFLAYIIYTLKKMV